MKTNTTTGQSLVEFALTLPILMLFVMGIFDLGRAVYYYSTIQNAAHEAARYGAVNHCDDTGITDRAISMAIGLASSDLVIETEPIYEDISGVLDYIQVTVTYTFVPVTPLIGNILSDGEIPLQATARQLIEVEYICPGT